MASAIRTMVDMESTTCTNGSTDNTHKTVLVTGGCGYIGSHTIVVLLQHHYNVVVVDNLINSSAISLDRVAKICNLTEEERKERLIFHQVDVCHITELRDVFQKYPQKFHSVIHFAGLKAVGESTRLPIRYYENNLIGTFNLINCMEEFGCHSIVFSSSATGTSLLNICLYSCITPYDNSLALNFILNSLQNLLTYPFSGDFQCTVPRMSCPLRKKRR